MTIVPPLKCQGIKTKLVPAIQASLPELIEGLWIEPFCGSGVVALNVQPKRAILADKNRHIIQLYKDIQQKRITPDLVREYLEETGQRLSQNGQDYYNEVRANFNQQANSLDFLFLNRACFNGVIRFNHKGEFNVPFGHKPDRFRTAYVTKIVNQVRKFQSIVTQLDWQFQVADFRNTLAMAGQKDFIYADPPYLGRHADYYGSWSESDEDALITLLQSGNAKFLLSTWHHNQHRANSAIAAHWQSDRFSIDLVDHFYHVGSNESLRGAVTEALIANYPLPKLPALANPSEQLALLEE